MRQIFCGDIGEEQEEYEFEPLSIPGTEPIHEPAAPTPAPVEPVKTPAKEPVPA